jgi:hypothetical protein
MVHYKIISVFSAIAISMSVIDLAHAKDFIVGSVKRNIPGDSACVAYLPNTQKYMLIVPSTISKSEPAYAWMNIDGKDVRLRQVSVKITQQKKRSIAKYRLNNIAVTVDSKQVKEEQGELTSISTIDRILIDYHGQTKTINTTGGCIF